MLSNIKINNLKPKDKEYPTADKNGLAIYTTPKGVKKWRFRFRYNKKASMISLGKYPIVSLHDARKARDECQALLHKGINPSDHKRQLKAQMESSQTFRSMFDKWFDRHHADWSERTTKKNLASFDKYVFPLIGGKSVSDITPLDMLKVFREMDDKGVHEVLKKIRGWTSRVFQDCVVSGLISFDPTRDLPRDAFSKPKVKHFATITDTKGMAKLLNSIDLYSKRGTYQVFKALTLAPHLFLRPSELSGMKWDEIDFKNKLIRIGSDRMKMSKDHLIPMSDFVVSELRSLKELCLSESFVFPSPNKPNDCINAESLRKALRTLGIKKEEFTTHGFRGMASTRLHEMGFRSEVIEVQLSHTDRNQARSAYNHALYLVERQSMMQEWSGYLNSLKSDEFC